MLSYLRSKEDSLRFIKKDVYRPTNGEAICRHLPQVFVLSYFLLDIKNHMTFMPRSTRFSSRCS